MSPKAEIIYIYICVLSKKSVSRKPKSKKPLNHAGFRALMMFAKMSMAYKRTSAHLTDAGHLLKTRQGKFFGVYSLNHTRANYVALYIKRLEVSLEVSKKIAQPCGFNNI